jgi:exopolysaccharide biosynthesis protein
MDNVNQVAKSEGLEAAVNASFFDVKQGQVLALGPTVVEGKEIGSYLDPEISEEKYGVFYCMAGNNCHISTLQNYKSLFGSKLKLPNLAVSGMSWSIKEGTVHPQSHGIKTRLTVIGLSRDRKVLYLIQGWGSYLDIANAALRAGAYNAFNFDGGGSSQLVFRNQKFPMFREQTPVEKQEFGPTTSDEFYAHERPVAVIFGVKELQ